MNGYGDFKYSTTLRRRSEGDLFFEVRNWCWETWGPSCELEFWDAKKNPAWAWNLTEFELKIYLTGDKEASWFTLKWS